MALRRRSRLLLPLVCLASALSFSSLAGTASAGPTGQIVVFWGRHKGEDSLREACDAGRYTTVVISFLSVFGHGRYQLDLSGHPLAGVGADIKHCQSKHVAVLLSIGGFGDQYSLPSPKSARDVADHLWDAFLGGRRKGVPRPFGDAEVDGVDFFIGNGPPEHYDELARRLAGHYAKKQYREPFLTATTRCSYPDRRVEKALATGLFFHIHVRMFGDDRGNCTAGDDGGAWNRWAAAYPGSLVYLGLVASPEQEYGEAWVFQKDLYYGVLPGVQDKANYGGVMIWDSYYDIKTGYSSSVNA